MGGRKLKVNNIGHCSSFFGMSLPSAPKRLYSIVLMLTRNVHGTHNPSCFNQKNRLTSPIIWKAFSLLKNLLFKLYRSLCPAAEVPMLQNQGGYLAVICVGPVECPCLFKNNAFCACESYISFLKLLPLFSAIILSSFAGNDCRTIDNLAACFSSGCHCREYELSLIHGHLIFCLHFWTFFL